MQSEKTAAAVRETVRTWRREGLSVGLVPTMGYLHEGHASLIERSVTGCDRTVVSIFVNPTQFGPGEDLATYPRDMERDTALCARMGANLIFNPDPEEMYPAGFSTFVEVEGLDRHLCGKSRPGHFRGVCTVVGKLFNIVTPDRAYFGQKDAQQLAILTRMARDLNMGVELVPCPIVRETDGLAKSSRNAYLNPEERRAAVILSKSIGVGRAQLLDGERDAAAVARHMTEVITSEPLAKIDYVELVDAADLRPVAAVTARVLAAVAVYIGKTRLIDNFVFDPEA